MRIRRGTKKLSSPEFSAFDSPETVVCHLNQSPWDAISLDSAAGNHQDASWFLPSSSSSSAYRFQLDGEDSLNGNASLRDSGCFESVASEKEKLGNEAMDHVTSRITNKTNKIHDLDSSSLKSCSTKKAIEKPSSAPPPRRGRPPGSVKKPPSAKSPTTAAASNPYEFYYYSGFGPRWGKKRGGAGGEESRKVVDKDQRINGKGYRDDEGRQSRFYDCKFDAGLGYMYDEDEDEDDDEDDEDEEEGMCGRKINGKMKKRGRKPVKARSLKSLM